MDFFILYFKNKEKNYIVVYSLFILVFYPFLYQALIKHNEFGISNPWDAIMLLWDTGSGHPIGMALWYIRNLIVFALLSPLYFAIVKYLRHFVLLIVLSLQFFDIPIDYPFFNEYLLLGSYISLSDISLDKVSSVFNWKICLFLYAGWKLFHFYFKIIPLNEYVLFFLCLVGLFGLFKKINIPEKYTISSTFIYLIHPYFTGIRNIYTKFIDTSSLTLDIFVWGSTTITIFIICFSIFYLMKRFSPKILSVVSGGRL